MIKRGTINAKYVYMFSPIGVYKSNEVIVIDTNAAKYMRRNKKYTVHEIDPKLIFLIYLICSSFR